MKSSTLRRIENLHRLVTALGQGGMGPVDVMQLLQVSYSAARNYFEELALAGIGEYGGDRGTQLRLLPDETAIRHYLATLAERVTQPRVSLRRSSSRHCANPGKRFLHVLADDVRFPLVLDCHPVRRDPLVAALFGAAHRGNENESLLNPPSAESERRASKKVPANLRFV
jgi:hypothetical protein